MAVAEVDTADLLNGEGEMKALPEELLVIKYSSGDVYPLPDCQRRDCPLTSLGTPSPCFRQM